MPFIQFWKFSFILSLLILFIMNKCLICVKCFFHVYLEYHMFFLLFLLVWGIILISFPVLLPAGFLVDHDGRSFSYVLGLGLVIIACFQYLWKAYLHVICQLTLVYIFSNEYSPFSPIINGRRVEF